MSNYWKVGGAMGAVVLLVFATWLILPSEEMGEVALDTACLTEISTERYSSNTLLKTFTCYDRSETRMCYYFKTDNGACIKLYRYWYDL